MLSLVNPFLNSDFFLFLQFIFKLSDYHIDEQL